MKVGDKVSDFCLKDATGTEHCLKDFLGKWVVLYFYPKDNTSGCTKEAIGFTELKPEFEKLGAVIVGVSKDSTKSHERFIAKHDLKVMLLSDPDHNMMEAFGAWGKKKVCGKETVGTIRSTYLIDPEGRIAHVWPKVRVKGHVDTVLQTLKEALNKPSS